MRYAFYPGCSMEATARDFGESTRAVLAALDVQIEEIPDWSCCGSTPAHRTNSALAVALPAFNLCKARDMGAPVMTACAACYSRLRAANHALREDAGERDRVGRVLGRPYDGSVPVHHLLDVLANHVGIEAIRRRVVRPLTGLRVACYYGCLLSRPPEVVAFDDPEHPESMDEIVAALGATPVDWPYKTECCGASLSITNPGVVCRLSHRILAMARQAGADCVTVACPLCQINLDMRQADAVRRYGPLPATPIPFVTQLIGLALGLTPKELALGSLMTPADELLSGVQA